MQRGQKAPNSVFQIVLVTHLAFDRAPSLKKEDEKQKKKLGQTNVVPSLFRFRVFFFFCRGGWLANPEVRNEKTAQRECCWAGYPADVPGSFARTSRVKTTGRPPKPWENQHLDADIHDLNVRTSMTPGAAKKLRAEKLQADLSFHAKNADLNSTVEKHCLSCCGGNS